MTSRENFEKWWDGYFHEINGQKETAYSAWKACTALHEAELLAKDREIAELKDKHSGMVDVYDRCRIELATLELDNKKLRDLLIEARDDVSNQLSEYQGLLPYKQHRYDAQKENLKAIDDILLTPLSTKALKEYRNGVIEECVNEVYAQFNENSQYNGKYIADKLESLKCN